MDDEANPFLIDIPMVALVKAVRTLGTAEAETPEVDCERVWFRTSVVSRANRVDQVQGLGGKREFPDPYGLDQLRPF
jgi:hypothetical protein